MFVPPALLPSSLDVLATFVLSQPCASDKPEYEYKPLSLPHYCCSERVPRWSGCGHLGSGPFAHRCCTEDLCCSECTSTWAKKQRFQGQDMGLHSDTPRERALHSTALFNVFKTCHLKGKCVISLMSPVHPQRWSHTAWWRHLPHLSAWTSLLHPPSPCWAHLSPQVETAISQATVAWAFREGWTGKTWHLCTPSAKPMIGIPLEVIPPEMAGSCCLLLQGKTLQRASKGISLSLCFFGSGSHYQLSEQPWV